MIGLGALMNTAAIAVAGVAGSFIGKAFDEASVFKTASALEEDIKFERK